jgi:hypothetical protein
MSDLYESNHSDIPYFDLTSHDLSEVGPLDFPFNCAEVQNLCSLFCNRDVKSLPKQLVRPMHL